MNSTTVISTVDNITLITLQGLSGQCGRHVQNI